MALPSWERKREGERMDLTCQWSLQRVVDLEDLDFDFCLRCLLCLHSPHQCWLCYLDQWVLKKRNGNLSLSLPLSLSPHFFLLSNISISLLNTSLLSFRCHFSHLQHHFLPLSPLFPYLVSLPLCLSSRLEIPPTRCLFIANSSS